MNRQEMLLTILIEECNEVAQRASKALRFGASEVQPGQPLTNAERIVGEMSDLVGVAQMLVHEGTLLTVYDAVWACQKKVKVEEYLKYSQECGTLEG